MSATYCGNPDHRRRTRAVARLIWPDGPYNTTTGCVGCTQSCVREAVHDGHILHIEPIPEEGDDRD